MPLLMMSGRPASGKTTRAKEIEKYLTEKYKAKVIILNEEYFGLKKEEAYVSSHQEKITRAFLKSNVEKLLDQDTVIIFDSLNYIKGYRFELHCRAKAVKTQYALIYCNITADRRKKWNSQNENKFPEKLFEELSNSYEVPSQGNRWDKPYFEVRDNEETPLEELAQILLFDQKTTKDPQSTKKTFEGNTQNYLFELDKKITDLINEITQKQGEALQVGSPIFLTGCTKPLKLQHALNLIFLKKSKQEFQAFLKQNPPKSLDVVGDQFVIFLQGRL
ncbi:P-loop containing nucleoside triphosphate hydrolase [Pseudocohnilembus persalinus]|uniref:p-loop containing nucleoside triphosphate hydrolase n=1 Tax=Pseudocohnilembus persalinus TaxID=266149 RepID=A0A0V0QL22_PSEPJ|nr:P-loop containing nucleoside triphosphate hydrolase [Pseudocohnilembus persalinus]|eukprot:KRX02812.1 P-loop containing nucleoside triphosphate hydrolase [Pseudocohnilembus persalinus]